MKVLAMDTSSEYMHISLVDNGRLIMDLKLKGVKHGRLLYPSISFLRSCAGLDLKGLDLVSLGVGPGSFTGIRVGLSFGIGLSMGLGVPAVGVSSLMAKALAASSSGVVLSLVDGRRGEVFYGVYRVDGDNIEALGCEGRVKVQDLPSLVPPGATVVVDGRDDFLRDIGEILDKFLTVDGIGSIGFSLAILGERRFKEKGDELPFIRAVYLRKSDPEEAKS